MTSTPSHADGSAETRAYRVIALAFGPAAVVFGLLAEPATVAQWPHFAPWWSVLVMIGVYVAPLLLCALSFIANARQIRGIAAVGAVAYLLGACLMGPALGGQQLADQASPWLLGVATVGTTLASLAWRMPIAAPVIVVASAFVAVDRVAAGGSGLLVTGLQDALYTFMFSIVFAALAQVATRSGFHVDSAAASARAEAVIAASARARLQERGRINALVHDSVLATLLAAGRGDDDRSYALVQAQARRALEQLSHVQDDSGKPSSLDAIDFTWALQAMTTDISPNAMFSHEVDIDCSIPANVVEAISEASLEALRNSERHAERLDGVVSRAVHVRVSTLEVEVTVLDDGVGYDQSRVSPTRLGVSVSIMERMRWLPGGDARVISLPGIGTRVSLSWRSK
jgi:signal transduction histidine kinase